MGVVERRAAAKRMVLAEVELLKEFSICDPKTGFCLLPNP
jgi:hypothetical protein